MSSGHWAKLSYFASTPGHGRTAARPGHGRTAVTFCAESSFFKAWALRDIDATSAATEWDIS